ncbi:uncharacterized protein [Typha angustifolia]|uniref:uncharacterized protein n=1 Tax=Typha angustifolia TaxID=59011 RepID=UPI003C2B5F98
MNGRRNTAAKSKKSSLIDPNADVDDLLRAAEDDLLLRLQVNSHPISSSSSSSLDPDLDRRLQALRFQPVKSSAPSESRKHGDEEVGRILGDDLAARFAALKASPGSDPVADRGGFCDDGGGEGSEKEVEKVLQWAMDVARLDAKSKDSSDGEVGEDEDGSSHGDEEDKEQEEEQEEESLGKEKRKATAKTKKWFFF